MSRRVQQLRRRPGVPSWVGAVLACLVTGLSEHAAVFADGQPTDPFQLPPPVADDEDFARELDRVRTLALPQQKDWARKIIKSHPHSDAAKLAQELLDEYALYDKLAAQESQRRRAWSRYVKAYWDARRVPAPVSHATSLTITNATQQPVLYQMKGYAMDWSGPYRLRPGEMHTFYYAIQYRSVTKDRTTVHSLAVGQSYEFRLPDVTGSPCLFELTD